MQIWEKIQLFHFVPMNYLTISQVFLFDILWHPDTLNIRKSDLENDLPLGYQTFTGTVLHFYLITLDFSSVLIVLHFRLVRWTLNTPESRIKLTPTEVELWSSFGSGVYTDCCLPLGIQDGSEIDLEAECLVHYGRWWYAIFQQSIGPLLVPFFGISKYSIPSAD